MSGLSAVVPVAEDFAYQVFQPLIDGPLFLVERFLMRQVCVYPGHPRDMLRGTPPELIFQAVVGRGDIDRELHQPVKPTLHAREHVPMLSERQVMQLLRAFKDVQTVTIVVHTRSEKKAGIML
jgi:hypothetical protein